MELYTCVKRFSKADKLPVSYGNDEMLDEVFNTNDRLKSWFRRGVICLALLLSLMPFIIVSIPPMTDLSGHLLVAHILNNYSQPNLKYEKYLDLELSAKPTTFAYILLAGF